MLFRDAFSLYESLCAYYNDYGHFERKHTRIGRYEILKAFFEEIVLGEITGDRESLRKVFCELLTCDVYLRENSKTRPGFAPDQEKEKGRFREFYRREDRERRYLKKYEGFHGRQLMTMTHIEHVSIDIEKTVRTGKPQGKECDLLFDYREKEPLGNQAKVSVIEITGGDKDERQITDYEGGHF